MSSKYSDLATYIHSKMELLQMQLASFSAIIFAAVPLLIVILAHRQRHTRKYNLPPGPRPWPVIGNLNLIGPLPHRSIHELSKRYGPFMSLHLGSVPVIVGSSIDMARSILKTNDLSFIDRPRTASGKYTHYNYSDMLWAPYGAYWRQARKLFQMEILSARQLRMLEDVRVEEVHTMLTGLHAAASAAGSTVVVLKEHLHMVSLNVISRMVLGKKYVVEDRAGGSPSPVTPTEFRWMIDEGFFLSGVINIGDLIPWVNWLDPQGYVRRMKRLNKMFDRFLEHVLEEHSSRRHQEGDMFVAKDMVDLLLQLAGDPNLEVPIGRDGVKSFVLVIKALFKPVCV